MIPVSFQAMGWSTPTEKDLSGHRTIGVTLVPNLFYGRKEIV
jgi:hypothetical protein